MTCRMALAMLAALWLTAAAGYAWRWPLQLPDVQTGAYRVTLEGQVYRHAVDAGLADVAVLDADGVQVPAALYAAQTPASSLRSVVLPMFELPASPERTADDVHLMAQRSADGRILRIDSHVRSQAAAPPDSAWLLDASAVHGEIRALRLTLADATAVQAQLRIDASDDLQEWISVLPGAAVIDLQSGGRRLQRTRLPIQTRARYLRIATRESATALPLTQVQAEVADDPASTALQWLDIAAQPGGSTRDGYHYRLPGRFPVVAADVVVQGNSAVRWQLHSRERDDAHWQPRAGPWVAYALGEAGRSSPQVWTDAVRDRHWRLSSTQATTSAPTLRLGYRAEDMVFVAAGKPPYTLVAGSATQRRQTAPVGELLAQVRAQHGEGWQPGVATLGKGAALAGASALQAPMDTRRWVLWGVLLLAAAVVALMAVALLRNASGSRE